MPDQPRFEVTVDDPDRVGGTLLVGLSTPGMAGLTATDYLVRQEDCDQIGYLTASGYPTPIPFADGVPRNHTRLYCLDPAETTLLVSELYLPIQGVTAFVDGILEWISEAPITEIVVLNGVPSPHGPEGHGVSSVATERFRERRLADAELPGLAGGYLDGPVGELLSRSLEGLAPPTGVYVTPTHPPGPDLDAALLFLQTLQTTHGIDVDVTELRELSDERKRYYADLAERMETLEKQRSADYPEDVAFT